MSRSIVSNRPIVNLREQPKPDTGRHPLKITTYPAYKTIHKRVGNKIITTRELIPGLKQYVMWFTDGTLHVIGAEYDTLQPFQLTQPKERASFSVLLSLPSLLTGLTASVRKHLVKWAGVKSRPKD